MIGPKTLIKTLEARSVKFRALGPKLDRLQVLYNKGDISRREKKLIEKRTPEILSILQEREKYKFLTENTDSIIHGDSNLVLKKFPANSFDQETIDPNYGIGFMGKDWDRSVPGAEFFKQCLRVLKPGGFAFIMCSPRQDVLAQMIINLKQAGFLVNFPSIYWTYASGFPKIHNIAKAVDKKNGAKGKVVGIKKNKINFSNSRKGDASFYNAAWQDGNYTDLEVTEPETEQAKKLKGAYAGFQPKPAVEVILVVMKPMTEKSYTGQAMANGKGCTWLDDCRIPYADENIPSRDLIKQKSSTSNQVIASQGDEWHGNQVGRMPANLLVSDNVLDDGKNHKGGGIGGWPKLPEGKCGFGFKPLGDKAPVRPNDEGGYSRFFSLDAWADRNLPFLNVPKASKAEKNAGLDGFPEQTVSDGRKTPNDTAFQRDITPRKNIHPTVKPVKLKAYLISLSSRPGDLIGDFAAGSGTTCVAAKLLGRKFIGIEKEEEYHRIAVARVENASLDVPVFKRAVADIKKHEESREQQEDDGAAKAPEPCFFSNMSEEQLKELDEAL
jgi:DNA modification methylase